jgi:Tol biopolymer transport system component
MAASLIFFPGIRWSKQSTSPSDPPNPAFSPVFFQVRPGSQKFVSYKTNQSKHNMTILKNTCVLLTGLLLGAAAIAQPTTPPVGEKPVLLMNRIGPSASELYMANADGSNEHKLLATSGLDYHASYSGNGQWIVFTSERNGLGQADIYRVHPDGTALERLTDSPALDDQAALSPDGSKVTFVSTREMHTANIWLLDIKSKKVTKLTALPAIQGDSTKPNGFFRPSWSPDGKWIAFASDRNTQWLGHGNGAGWEHVQELGIYVVHPDGTGLRKLSQGGICSGSPKWSPDGKRVVFYELPVEDTWAARRPNLAPKATSQIVSVDLATGQRTEHTAGPGLKLMPQFVTAETIGYLAKGGPNAGIAYTNGKATLPGAMRSPAWSPDGSHVVYEKVDFTHRQQNQPLYSWDTHYDYRYTDVFPNFAKDGKLVVTDKDFDSSISIMDADGSNKQKVYTATRSSVAFAPAWSPDGQRIAFGFGGYLQSRKTNGAKVMMVNRDGSNPQDLTDGLPNSGFPSWSPDGQRIVYRVWGEKDSGLRILNLNDKLVQVLTTEYDNLPFWSPDGSLISFTRKHDDNNFDIFTIRPDGTNLRQLTTTPANDAHAYWTADSKHLMWSSGIYGFKDEAALYDNTFQPYGAIFSMNADGSDKRQLTDSAWEDSMPVVVPKAGQP